MEPTHIEPTDIHYNIIDHRMPDQIGETIDVELRPHIGTQQTRLGPVQVEHDQYIIMAGRHGDQMLHIGYVGKAPGAPINFLRQDNGQPWPGPIKIAVREAIAQQLGSGARREGQPPEPTPPDDFDDDWDDDDLELDDTDPYEDD